MMSQEAIDAAILVSYANATDSALQRAVIGLEKWIKRHPESCLVEEFMHRVNVLQRELQRRLDAKVI